MGGPSEIERRQIAELLWDISQQFGEGRRGWEAMIARLGAPATTAAGWLRTGPTAKPPRSIPNGYYLAKIMRLGGLLSEDFQRPNQADLVTAAVERAENAAAEARRLARRARDGRGTGG